MIPCMHCICSSLSTHILYGLRYLILRFPAKPLSGLVGKAAPPPIKCTCPLSRLASALEFFYMVRSPTYWIFPFDSLLCLFQKIYCGPCSVLEGSIRLFNV